MSRFDIIGR